MTHLNRNKTIVLITLAVFIFSIIVIYFVWDFKKIRETIRVEKEYFYQSDFHGEIKNIKIGDGRVEIYLSIKGYKKPFMIIPRINENDITLLNYAEKGDSAIKKDNSMVIEILKKDGKKEFFWGE